MTEEIRNRVETMPVGIVVERRDSSHPWADNIWLPVAVIPGAPAMDPGGPWKKLKEGEGWEQYHAGTLEIEVFRTDTEAYLDCLSGDPPSVFVVLREDLEGEHELKPFIATVSSFEAQDYLDGEDLVEAVPMPDGMIAWLSEFIEFHHKDEPFKKRKQRRHYKGDLGDKPRYGRGSGWSDGHDL